MLGARDERSPEVDIVLAAPQTCTNRMKPRIYLSPTDMSASERAAVAALVVLARDGVAMGALARVKLGSPVLFRQARLGRGLFELIEFRTMSDERDPAGARSTWTDPHRSNAAAAKCFPGSQIEPR
jgi:hypothetical protein